MCHLRERVGQKPEDRACRDQVMIDGALHYSLPNTASIAPRMSSGVKGFLM
jgi:hypothetical protein